MSTTDDKHDRITQWLLDAYASLRGIRCEDCDEVVQPEDWDWEHHGLVRVPVCPICGEEGDNAFTPGETEVVSA